jgi:hypothetical protein
VLLSRFKYYLPEMCNGNSNAILCLNREAEFLSSSDGSYAAVSCLQGDRLSM